MFAKLTSYFHASSFALVLVLVLMLIIQRECHHCPACPEVPKPQTTVQIKVDTLYYPWVVPVPQIEFRDTGSWHQAFQPIDTAAIVREFLTKNVYHRTLVNDTNALIILTDTVFQNKLCEGYIQAQFYPYTRIITQTTTIMPPARRKLFIGTEITLYPIDYSFAPSLLYQSKKDHAYSVSFNPFTQNIRFSTWWKIQLRRE